MTPRTHPIGWASAFWALAVSAVWGGNVVAIKLGLTAIPPLWSAFWRMLLGTLIVAAFALTQRVSLRPVEGEARSLVTLGLLFTAQISLLNIGTNLTSPGFAVVLLNSHPVFANLAGHFQQTEEKLSALRILGLMLAMAGVGYVFLGKPEPSLAPSPILGNLLMVVSAALLGVRSVYTRRLVQEIEPLRAVVWMMLVSVPLFLVMAVLREPVLAGPVTAPPVAAILFQGIAVAGFCFIVWTLLLRKHPAGTISMFAFTVPFFGVLLSLWLFGEPVSPRLLAGAALVTAGIVIVARPPRAPWAQVTAEE